LTRSLHGTLSRTALALACALALVQPATASEPLEDSVRTVRDTVSGHKPLPLGRILSEADSVVKAQGGPRADDAQLFLSWNAPWGSRRALRERRPACSDSTREDTLYLSVLPGRTAKRFAGFTGQLFFRATSNDTLGPWWHMEGKGGENAGALRVEWAAAPGFGWKQPFAATGQGFVILDRTPAVARLRMVFAVAYDDAVPIGADSIYALCRVILKHNPSRRLAGCEKPVCVEWGKATLAFGPKDEPEVSRGERFVAYSGAFAICEPFRGPRVASWKPPKPQAQPAPATKPE
jgi:hypothetical protein